MFTEKNKPLADDHPYLFEMRAAPSNCFNVTKISANKCGKRT
jgi:hypothetical protein